MVSEFATGDWITHEVYGKVQISGFITVADEIEVNELERDGEMVLDVVHTVQGEKVEFIDKEGHEHVEPLRDFYQHMEDRD